MKNTRIDVVQTVIYLVAVYVVTIATAVYQPATGGYFNLGEAVIYLAAILSGPLTAAVAGGAGAALADLSTGYGIFAPATLAIKFIEGLLAGTLVRKIKGKWGGAGGALVGVFYTALLIFFAVYYWAGKVYIGPEQFLNIEIETPLITIPLAVWIVIALIIGGLVSYALIKKMIGALEAVALLLAGLEMVIGYFLYEYFVSNPLTNRPPIDAIAEIPVNIGQSVIGAAIAIPLAAWLRRAGYAKQENT